MLRFSPLADPTVKHNRQSPTYPETEGSVERMEKVCEVADGLWIWTTSDQQAGAYPPLTSTLVASRGETLVLDPLAPRDANVWERLDEGPPTAIVILKPDHVRDVDLFAKRYGAPAFGPRLFFRDDVPAIQLKPIEPGSQLPGGIVALYDGRGRCETPLWLPEQHTIVFADGMHGLAGELHVWPTPWHRERTLPALRAMLELPFTRVIVSHGKPVHDRADFERALELDLRSPGRA